MQVNPAAAADDIASGVFGEVPWRVTSSYELIIGAEGGTYTFDYSEGRLQGAYPWYRYYRNIVSCRFAGTVNGNGSHESMFDGYTALREIDLSGFHTDNATRMSHMFRNCSSLTSLDLSGFNTSRITDMSSMFENCSSLTSLNISSFDTSNVTTMLWMFRGCSAALDVQGLQCFDIPECPQFQHRKSDENGFHVL